MGQLTERDKYPRTSSRYAQISANIRLRLKQFNNEVEQLKQKLDVSSTNAMYPFNHKILTVVLKKYWVLKLYVVPQQSVKDVWDRLRF